MTDQASARAFASLPVATVVGMVGEGMAEAEILNAYPDLEVEDVREALRYAAEAVREREHKANVNSAPRFLAIGDCRR